MEKKSLGEKRALGRGSVRRFLRNYGTGNLRARDLASRVESNRRARAAEIINRERRECGRW